MNSNYNIKQWAEGTKVGRQIYTHNYYLTGKEFKRWTLIKTVSIGEEKDLSAKAYILASSINPRHEMVRIDITERHYWRTAQISLREHLENSMRANIPEGTKDLAKIGDKNFVGLIPGSAMPASIKFTLGNLFISIRSVSDKHVDVSEIAFYLDKVLGSLPVKGKKVKVKKTLVKSIIIKNVRRETPAGRWLKIIVPDGEVRREGDAILFLSDKDEKKEVIIYEVKPND